SLRAAPFTTIAAGPIRRLARWCRRTTPAYRQREAVAALGQVRTRSWLRRQDCGERSDATTKAHDSRKRWSRALPTEQACEWGGPAATARPGPHSVPPCVFQTAQLSTRRVPGIIFTKAVSGAD